MRPSSRTAPLARTVLASLAFVAAVGLAPPAAAADDGEARLLRDPDVDAAHVVFVHAGDVWVAPRDGGRARRLTTFPGEERWPHLSPDGTLVAFTGEYDGNQDVYVVAVEGGEPRRLTWHPGLDDVRGWTPDGSAVVFSSGRVNAPRTWPRWWTVPLAGGMPTALPLPRVEEGSFSPDGHRLAYQRVQPWDTEWRNYRGGQANPIRLVDLDTLEERDLPWEGSNDVSPVWIGGTVFFLSDRDWASNVWAYDVASGELVQRTHFHDFDCRGLEGGAGSLTFENGGYLYTLDPAGGEPRKLSITLAGDFPWARPHWVDAQPLVQTADLAPNGKRAVFEARGEVFTVPADKGDARNLTLSSGAADRSPAWSPDGRSVAWFSDQGGEYAVVIADPLGRERRSLPIPGATFFMDPEWSPDSQHLAFGDADRNLWLLDVASGEAKTFANEGSTHPFRMIHPVWSPDSRWIAYSRRLRNQFNAVFVYSLASGESHQVTDGLSNAHSPAWDRSGKYLYFLASTDFGLNVGWLDLSSYGIHSHYGVYVAVLAADEPSPLAPESDEGAAAGAGEDGGDGEKGGGEEAENDGGGDEPPAVRIDFAGLGHRVLALDLPLRRYAGVVSGPAGTVFIGEEVENQEGATLHRYSLAERKDETLLTGVASFRASADGARLLVALPDQRWFVLAADRPPGPPGEAEKALDLSGLRMKVDPPAEWRQIFKEAWRFERDYFYVDNVHGLDLDWAWRTYAPWLDHVRHRTDLTYLLNLFGAETSVGHSWAGAGDEPEVEPGKVGLLGADLEVADGRYRFARIFDGESWNPELRAPLRGPGLDVETGDYLLAVDGVELTAAENPFSRFDHAAGRQVRITVNGKPTLDGARELTVVPIEDDNPLRLRAWVEDNRRKVDELSGGKLAYVWVPDTGDEGHTSFTRYFFAQIDKQGVIVDERYNHGGYAADYVVDLLARTRAGWFNNPVADRVPFGMPAGVIPGPRVMVINEMSGSGGDLLPYMFRQRQLGPLVGTRTWGGLVGIWDVPLLVDGGFITAPRGGFIDLAGHWAVENEGVAPDVEVRETPLTMAGGHDPQLEKAVEIALTLLPTDAAPPVQPPDPVRWRRPER